MNNYNENEIIIPPVGLLNFNIKNQNIWNYNNYKDLKLWNACYINASIQCLFRLDEFVKNILKYKGSGKLTNETKILINKMKNFNKQKEFCSVLEIKKVMGENNELYNGNNEGDANEFISNYLNDLIEETKNTGDLKWSCLPKDEKLFNKFKDKFIQRKGKSFILELFYGILRTEKYCKCKNTTSIKFNTFNILEIPIYEDGNKNKDKPLDINSLLNKFFDEKKDLDEICPNCKKNFFYKTSINSLPKCLIIFFRRDYSNYKRNYININPKMPISIEKYLYDKSLNNNNQFYYHLKGIIFYSYYKKFVSHYKATCFVNNRQWFSFNDNYCERLKVLSIEKNENPVILFYEK